MAKLRPNRHHALMRQRFVFWAMVIGIVLFAFTSSALAEPGGGASPRVRASLAVPRAGAHLGVSIAGSTRVSGPREPLKSMSAPRPPAPRHFTVLAAGDVLLHPSLWTQAIRDARDRGRTGYDFDPIFASARPRIAGADLAICHLETPVGARTGPFTGYPVFAVPPAIAMTLHDIGYDTCSTASNHSLDDSELGIDRTLDALDAAHVKHTGTARSAKEAMTTDLLRVNGVTVAQLSYAFGFNGARRPAGKAWLANLINVPAILAAAHRAKEAGADVVIVSLHFGTEYQPAPNAQQRSVAEALLASPDIDLIVGCHAHVVQPFQEIHGKWVVYGMGNQIATQGFSQQTMDGVMARFTFTEVKPGVFRATLAEAIPTYTYLGGPIRLIDLPAELAKPGLSPVRRALYATSWTRTAREVRSLGAQRDGLVVVRAGAA